MNLERIYGKWNSEKRKFFVKKRPLLQIFVHFRCHILFAYIRNIGIKYGNSEIFLARNETRNGLEMGNFRKRFGSGFFRKSTIKRRYGSRKQGSGSVRGCALMIGWRRGRSETNPRYGGLYRSGKTPNNPLKHPKKQKVHPAPTLGLWRVYTNGSVSKNTGFYKKRGKNRVLQHKIKVMQHKTRIMQHKTHKAHG